MLKLLYRRNTSQLISASQLYNEHSFYGKLFTDLGGARRQVIIESPFLTHKRTTRLLPLLRQLTDKGVSLIINTRNPNEHEGTFKEQASVAIGNLQSIGARVLYTGSLHRKICIIDDTILWEGSLNILSQADSCEIMRRSNSSELVKQMLAFTRLERFAK